MNPRRLLPLLVATSLCSSRAHAAEDLVPTMHWVPTAGLALGAFHERFRVRVDGENHDETRGQLRAVNHLGLAHPVARLQSSRAWIDGHASVGLGPAFHTGHWHVPFREDVTFAYAPARWLTLRAGLGAGLTVDATLASRSFGEMALPLSLTFLRVIELVYRPMLSVPLGSNSADVFGGNRQLSTQLGVQPFELQLRLRFNVLGA